MVTALALVVAAASGQTPFSPIRVNAGGPAYTDPAGNVWAADTGAVSANASYSVASAITGTTTPTLYQSETYCPACTLEYRFAVPNGAYNVTLKFAEIWFTAAGQRVFSISINGTQVESSFDIFSAAGGQNKAIDKTYPVSVTGGVIDIQEKASADNPKVSAIDIEPAPVTTTSTGTTPTVIDATAVATLQDQLSTLQNELMLIQQQIPALQGIVNGYSSCSTATIAAPVAQ